MRSLLVMALLAGTFSGALRADFSYESKIVVTAGALARETKKPVVAMHLIKGNRMATVTKGHTTIVDLDKETILEIDLAKKTYYSMTFAQMKQTLDQALKESKARTTTNPETAFQVSSKSTGRTRTIGFWTEKEQTFSMTNQSATKEAGPGSQPVTQMFVDSWMVTYPGFSEAEDFRKKLAGKLSYAYASGMFEIGMVKPELLPGFDEFGKLFNEGDNAPIETTIRMGAPGSGDLTPAVDETSSSQKSVVAGALSRLGNMGRRKSAAAADEETPPGLLVEMTVELSNFSGGLADESKFNVPAGFKQVSPPAGKINP